MPKAEKPKKGQIKGILKLLILKELEKSDATGYDLIKKISIKTSKKPSPGSVYPLLKELTNSGFLSVRDEGKKKIYSISEKGKKILKEISTQEKEAILRKIDVLKESGIIGEDEVNEVFQLINFKRELWIKLFELRNWTQFLRTISRASENSKDEVERILDEMIEKLEKIKRRI
ncbi:hypothetical protein DRO97_06285 [Archaeoglobales archaeon]|nr:MAG: hypothetical protein DRO97_06285 [Archaeoglobales archaeon]